MQETKINAE